MMTSVKKQKIPTASSQNVRRKGVVLTASVMKLTVMQEHLQ